jgi:hypothetical protein
MYFYTVEMAKTEKSTTFDSSSIYSDSSCKRGRVFFAYNEGSKVTRLAWGSCHSTYAIDSSQPRGDMCTVMLLFKCTC